MGLMDKIKAQANALAETGQSKLTGFQAKKHADALLLELGGLTYQQHSGRAPAGAEARAGELVAELDAHEAQYGPIAVTLVTPPPGGSGSYVPGTAPPASSAAPAGGPVPGAPTPGEPSTPPGAGGGLPTGSYLSDQPPG